MLSALLALIRAILMPGAALAIENAALRQQIAVYVRTNKRPKLELADRAFWVALRRAWSGWARALITVKPTTMIGWHRTPVADQALLEGLQSPVATNVGPGRPRGLQNHGRGTFPSHEAVRSLSRLAIQRRPEC